MRSPYAARVRITLLVLAFRASFRALWFAYVFARLHRVPRGLSYDGAAAYGGYPSRHRTAARAERFAHDTCLPRALRTVRALATPHRFRSAPALRSSAPYISLRILRARRCAYVPARTRTRTERLRIQRRHHFVAYFRALHFTAHDVYIHTFTLDFCAILYAFVTLCV